MRKLVWIALSIILCIPLSAQDRGLDVKVKGLGGPYAVAGKQYAVLIAIDSYRNWIPLRNPVKDAREIKAILSRRYYIDEFIELYDGAATKAGIARAFADLIRDTKTEDSVFIYYAGHGHLDPDSQTGFWIPVDGGTDVYGQENWIPNSQVRGYIGHMKSRHVALVSDSCFSGDILNPTRAMAPQITDEYFRNAYARVSRQVLTSGASEAVPDDSPFSRQIKMALEGNMNPYLDPFMLFSEVRLGVKGTTPLFGELKDSGHQDGGSFLFFLRDTATAAAKVPRISSVKSYGSVVVDVKQAGTLYMDGVQLGALNAGTSRLDDVEIGERVLEMRYPDGRSEKVSVTVRKDGAVPVGFVYVRGPEAPAGTVFVKGGAFRMGSDAGASDEKPVHEVRVSDFFMMKCEVTQKEYAAVMGANPAFGCGVGDTYPVYNVSWYDAVAYANKLSQRDGLRPCYTINGTDVSSDWSANGWRLPTEAEWEYAARGGMQSKGYSYAGSNVVDVVAWYSSRRDLKGTQPVGMKAPNELGLFDMSGNVQEWCWDWEGIYSVGSQTDPRGAATGSTRVSRGGCWINGASFARSYDRSYDEPAERYGTLGFRLVRPSSQ